MSPVEQMAIQRRVNATGPRMSRQIRRCSTNRYPLWLDGALRATCRCHWMETD